jgi:hypothetical protein
MRKVYAFIELFDEENDGRATPIPPIQFRCLLLFEGIKDLSAYPYDCRMFFNERAKGIKPGEVMEDVPIAFLSPEKIFPYINIGTKFLIRDGKIIGNGVITSMDMS